MDDFDSTLWNITTLNAGIIEWTHINALYFDINEEDSSIYISSRHLSRITKIDYPSGDILWNMGHQMPSGDVHFGHDLGFSWQHSLDVNNGNIVFLDNGNKSEDFRNTDYRTTRAMEISIDESSTIPAAEIIWEYDLPENLYGHGTGSAQLLDNGNYSIYTQGGYVDCSILEVSSDKELIWQAEAFDPTSSFYRAYKIPSIYPEAFSVLANRYTQAALGGTIELLDSSLVFEISNKSGYTNTYKYNFENPQADWFEDVEGEIIINPYQTDNISFTPIQTDNDTEVILTIYPKFHDYAQKQLSFTVIESEELLGDLNGDFRLNIEDIILMVNMVLDLEINETLADMNGDGGINILDISILINLILNS